MLDRAGPTYRRDSIYAPTINVSTIFAVGGTFSLRSPSDYYVYHGVWFVG